MLFYTALAVACIILAAVALWVVRSIYEVGKSAYRAILPSARQNEPAQAAQLNNTVNDTPMPWGWRSGGRRPGRARAATTEVEPAQPGNRVPWGWPGNRESRPSGARRIAEGSGRPGVLQQVKRPLERIATRAARQVDTSNVGWPYREERFEFAGRTFTVQRQETRKPGKARTGKPWGW